MCICLWYGGIATLDTRRLQLLDHTFCDLCNEFGRDVVCSLCFIKSGDHSLIDRYLWPQPGTILHVRFVSCRGSV